MRPFLAAAALAVLALLAWWWARGADPARAAHADREGSGEPAAVAPAGPDEADSGPEPAPEAARMASAQLAEHTIRVIDEAGAAIAGAWVEVRRSERDEITARAVTDGLGRATVALARDDEIFAGASGFMTGRIRSARRRGIAEVVLERGYRIAGAVVDGGGRGIAGAALTLEEPFLPARSATSGPDGRFAFDGVSDEKMSLRANAGGYLESWIIVAPGDTEVCAVLGKLVHVQVTGVVLFPDGLPAAGARIDACVAGADGRFTLGDVRPGPYPLVASLEAGGRAWRALSVIEVAEDGMHDPIRLVLEPVPRSWVNVRVVERDGAPVSGVTVGPLNAVTDAEGRAVLAFDVPRGKETLVWVGRPRHDGLLPGRAEVVTGARDGPEILLPPRDPLLVTIVVRGPDGAALPPGVAAFVRAYGNTVVRRERDMAVVAVDPAAVEFSLTVDAPGFVQKFARLPPPADGHVEIRLHGSGTITCRLADEHGAAVLDGAVHALVRGVGAAGAEESEPDGTYRLAGVPVGRALVTAGHDDDLSLVQTEADVRAGEVTDLGTLVLRSPRTLSGRVTDANGHPVGGAEAYAIEGDYEKRVFSRSDGTFRIEVPPWFDGFVLATKPGHGSVHRRASSGPLELVLQQEGKVRLEVRMPPFDGRTRGWSFAARDPSTGFRWSRVEWQRIEKGTTYLVSGLPPGRLILICAIEPKDAETDVVVVPGGTVPAVIDAPE